MQVDKKGESILVTALKSFPGLQYFFEDVKPKVQQNNNNYYNNNNNNNNNNYDKVDKKVSSYTVPPPSVQYVGTTGQRNPQSNLNPNFNLNPNDNKGQNLHPFLLPELKTIGMQREKQTAPFHVTSLSSPIPKSNSNYYDPPEIDFNLNPNPNPSSIHPSVVNPPSVPNSNPNHNINHNSNPNPSPTNSVSTPNRDMIAPTNPNPKPNPKPSATVATPIKKSLSRSKLNVNSMLNSNLKNIITTEAIKIIKNNNLSKEEILANFPSIDSLTPAIVNSLLLDRLKRRSHLEILFKSGLVNYGFSKGSIPIVERSIKDGAEHFSSSTRYLSQCTAQQLGEFLIIVMGD
jgi:hypothetical protein